MESYYRQADEILANMTVEQKIGQMIMASIEVTKMDGKTRDFLRKNQIGNVILFGKNCVDRPQLARLNRQIQDEITAYTGGVQALLSIDQEGGPVTRIRRGATVFPCAAAIGATGDPDLAYLEGRIMGNELRALGIAFNLAPVLDTNGAHKKTIPMRRSFGPTALDTALYGGAYARGLRDAGLIDCGKHFPGSGDSTVDPHFATSVVHTPFQEMMENSVRSFRQVMAEGMRAIMTSHTCYTGLEPRCIPATLSSTILQDLVRNQMGFRGLIISDGLQMLAIAGVYGAARGCVLAVQAGCDLVITGNGGDNANPNGEDVQSPCVQALRQAVETGELSMERVNDAARRIIAHKLMLGNLYPAEDVAGRDWRAHEAFAAALAEMAVALQRDKEKLLPLPQGALFLSRASRAQLGVEEGDRLVDGFAPMAARLCRGKSVEFEHRPELPALRERIEQAPAVVFGVASHGEMMDCLEDLRCIYQWNHRLCLVCLDVPAVAEPADFVPCVLTSYDQTANAIRAVCKALQRESHS